MRNLREPGKCIQDIKRASDVEFVSAQDMGVDHGGPHILMTQQLLYRANIVPILQEVGGEGMSEGMTGSVFRDL